MATLSPCQSCVWEAESPSPTYCHGAHNLSAMMEARQKKKVRARELGVKGIEKREGGVKRGEIQV